MLGSSSRPNMIHDHDPLATNLTAYGEKVKKQHTSEPLCTLEAQIFLKLASTFATFLAVIPSL